MEIGKHYSLVKEHPSHFELHDSRDGKKFNVAKKDLHPAHQIKLMKMQKFADGGEAEDTAPEDTPDDTAAVPGDASASQAPYYLQANPAADQAPPTSAPQPTPGASGSWDPEMPKSAAPDASAAPPMPGAGSPTVDDVKNLVKAQTNAEMTQAKAQTDINQEQARTYQAYLEDENHRQQDFQGRMQSYQQNADQLTKDITDAKIDPNRYWHNASTGQKISAGVAMLLGGLSQGLLRGGPNQGSQAIQETINRDIDAQKSELGKKQTLLSDNLRTQGNLQAAENATRIQTNAMLQGQLQKTALASGNPVVMAKAQQAVAQLKLQAMPMIQSVAANQTKLQVLNSLQKGNVSQQDPSKFVQWVVPADKQKDVNKEIADRQNSNSIRGELKNQFNQAAKDVRFTSGGNPAYSTMITPPSIKTMDALTLPLIHDKEGRVNEFEQKTVKDLFPQAWDNDATIKKKWAGFENFLDGKSAAPTAKSFGIDLDKFDSTKRADSAPETQMKGGVKYQQVPGGWAPVK